MNKTISGKNDLKKVTKCKIIEKSIKHLMGKTYLNYLKNDAGLDGQWWNLTDKIMKTIVFFTRSVNHFSDTFLRILGKVTRSANIFFWHLFEMFEIFEICHEKCKQFFWHIFDIFDIFDMF